MPALPPPDPKSRFPAATDPPDGTEAGALVGVLVVLELDELVVLELDELGVLAGALLETPPAHRFQLVTTQPSAVPLEEELGGGAVVVVLEVVLEVAVDVPTATMHTSPD